METPAAGGAGARTSVLVAEDDSVAGMLLREALTLEGYEVDLVPGIAAARQALSTSRPDVVVADLTLADGSGFELISAVRARPDGAPIPIIVLSGHHQRHLQQQALELGVNAYITKPFSPSDLIDQIELARGS